MWKRKGVWRENLLGSFLWKIFNCIMYVPKNPYICLAKVTKCR